MLESDVFDRARPIGAPPPVRKLRDTGPDIAPTLTVINPATWSGKAIPAREWVVPGIIPLGNVVLLTGDGGVGKSLLLQSLMTSVSAGAPWLGREVRHLKCFSLFCEDDPDELHRRQADLNRIAGLDFSQNADMRFVSGIDRDNVLMTWPAKGDGPGRVTPYFREIEQQILDFGTRLIAVDTVADTFGGNENFRAQVRGYCALWRGLAKRTRGTVLLSAHPSVAGMATGTGMSGSTAWNNSVRQRLYLTRPKGDDEDGDDNARELRTMKANYGSVGGKVRIRWAEGGFVSDEPAGGMMGALELRRHETVFLELLALTYRQDGKVSDSPNAGNYAPKVFADHPKRQRTNRREFEKAMRVLIADGRVIREKYGRAGDERWKLAVAGQVQP